MERYVDKRVDEAGCAVVFNGFVILVVADERQCVDILQAQIYEGGCPVCRVAGVVRGLACSLGRMGLESVAGQSADGMDQFQSSRVTSVVYLYATRRLSYSAYNLTMA